MGWLCKFFMLIFAHSVEVIELRKHREALDKEWQDMRARHIRDQSAYLYDCMKKNYPERYEQVLERFRKAEEFQSRGGNQPV